MTPDQLSSLLLPLLLVVLFWVMILRPARRRQREVAQTQAALQPGSRVMLASGVYGDVDRVEEDTIGLTVAPGVTLVVARQAVAKVVAPVADGAAEAPAPHGATDR